MSGNDFLAELRLFSFNFAPKGWAQCNGQFMPINQNQALFSLLGTTYGGNGQTTFALPDMRGRTPQHMGQGWTLGEVAGEEAHTLTISELPVHQHFLNAATADGDTPVPAGSLLGSFNNGYRTPSNGVVIASSTVSNVGGSQAHNNMQPFLVMTYGICLQGIFPSQN